MIKKHLPEILRLYEAKTGILSIAVRLGVSARLVRFILDGRPDPITGDPIDYNESESICEMHDVLCRHKER